MVFERSLCIGMCHIKNKNKKVLHIIIYFSWNREQSNFFQNCGIALIPNQSSHTIVCFESHIICREYLLHNTEIAHLNSREFYTSVNINTMQMMIYWFSFIYDLLFIDSCRVNVKCILCSSKAGKRCRILGSAILHFKK